jgi:hypothetical protein
MLRSHHFVNGLVDVPELAEPSGALGLVPRLELRRLDELPERDGLVLVLVALFAGLRGRPAGRVDDPDPGLDLVDVLAALTRAPERLDFEVRLCQTE